MENIKASIYLGKHIFDLYKEKHPEVNAETVVHEVPKQYAEYGFAIPAQDFSYVWDMKPTTSTRHEEFVFKPEDFENWAVSKSGYHWLLCFIPQRNLIYAVPLPPLSSR